MPDGHTTTYIPMERECDLCNKVAYADASMPGGVWAYLCKSHFNDHGCTLGLGRGQRLIVGQPPVRERTADDEMRARVADALGCTEDEIDL